MSETFGKFGPKWPLLGRFAQYIANSFNTPLFQSRKIYRQHSRFTKEKLASLRSKIERGETSYLVGIGPCVHNTGVSLVSISQKEGINLISNDEEERFVAIKHCNDFPENSIMTLAKRLEQMGLSWRDIHAWIATWDFPAMFGLAWKTIFEELPTSFPLFKPSSNTVFNIMAVNHAMIRLARILGKTVGFRNPQPVIVLPHHDNHAAATYCLSPFGKSQDTLMIAIMDGFGDEGAISTYLVKKGHLYSLRKNYSVMDSLGFFFTIMSSSKGGWTPLSSEGRYMGAAAWGDLDRLTNPYYKRLREIFHFCADGQVFINRKMANWQNTGELKPFKKPLIDLVGPPIPQKFLWNPDHVLQVEDIQHSEVTKERVDLAAATQLIFEDAVFHIVENLIRISGSDKLLLAGGSALNCLANMKLLERFDNHWYRRNLNKDTCLQLWVPPFPGDAGVPPGAAMNFALQAGGRPGRPMKHAFYCGHPPEIGDIDSAIEEDHEISKINFGNVNDAKQLVSLADLMAYILSKDGVVGIFQGSAETGPRALGHRSILANPCNPLSLQTINKLVKYREPIRPLAPMATIKAASELFELQLGAEADDFNVYHYMIMTVRARPVAYEKIPAVVHKDGTVRLQLVNQRSDPVCYAFLQSMGRRLGVEASVNTSLNIGGPIVQTPIQALQVLKKAKALTILVMIGAEGSIRLAWHNVNIPPKDGGVQFKNWLEDWSTQQHKNLIIA